MSLLDDVKAWYDNESAPPAGLQLDYVIDAEGVWVKGDTTTVVVNDEDLEELRWGTRFQRVFQRGGEFVAIEDVRPATEMQGWGDYGEPEIYAVFPKTKTVTITTYEKV